MTFSEENKHQIRLVILLSFFIISGYLLISTQIDNKINPTSTDWFQYSFGTGPGEPRDCYKIDNTGVVLDNERGVLSSYTNIRLMNRSCDVYLNFYVTNSTEYILKDSYLRNITTNYSFKPGFLQFILHLSMPNFGTAVNIDFKLDKTFYNKYTFNVPPNTELKSLVIINKGDIREGYSCERCFEFIPEPKEIVTPGKINADLVYEGQSEVRVFFYPESKNWLFWQRILDGVAPGLLSGLWATLIYQLTFSGNKKRKERIKFRLKN